MPYSRNTSVSPYVFPGLKLSSMDRKFINFIKPKLTPKEVFEVLSNESGLTIEQILSKVRKGEYVDCRHIFCHIARKHMRMNLVDIAKNLNYNDHTTVIHSITKFDDRFKQCEVYRDRVKKIYHMLGIS